MKKVNIWLWQRLIRHRLFLAVLICGNVVQALLGVAFAAGSKRVIDGAIGGDRSVFIRAVILQLVIILSMIAVQAFLRHLRDMLDAQIHPENHRQLVVRIWGWSAYFVELDKPFQDHVIRRQEYRM